VCIDTIEEIRASAAHPHSDSKGGRSCVRERAHKRFTEGTNLGNDDVVLSSCSGDGSVYYIHVNAL
jgi:hypothetical protein